MTKTLMSYFKKEQEGEEKDNKEDREEEINALLR